MNEQPTLRADLAARLDALHQRDHERRERQRQHAAQAGGECRCFACQADGPAPLSVPIDELLSVLRAGGGGQ